MLPFDVKSETQPERSRFFQRKLSVHVPGNTQNIIKQTVRLQHCQTEKLFHKMPDRLFQIQ